MVRLCSAFETPPAVAVHLRRRRCRFFFRQTGDDFDLLRVELVLVVHFEVHILNDKRPDFVAESICI